MHIFVDFLNRQNSLRIFHVCWVVVDKLRRSFERNNHGISIRKSEQGVNERDNIEVKSGHHQIIEEMSLLSCKV
jgi:hypothetical protein